MVVSAMIAWLEGLGIAALLALYVLTVVLDALDGHEPPHKHVLGYYTARRAGRRKVWRAR